MGVFQRGKYYYVLYYHNGKRIKESTKCTSKKTAESILAKRKTQIAENKHLDIRKQEKITFKDFANEYIEIYAKPNKKSWQSDEENLKSLKVFFGDKYLYEITTQDIEKYKALKLQDKKKPATVNRQLATLKIMFTKAIEWNKIADNPSKKVKFLKEKNNRLRYLTLEEINNLLDNCPKSIKSIVIIALHTGMRRGEILGLKWENVDIKQGIIYLLDTKNNERAEIFANSEVIKALLSLSKNSNNSYLFSIKDLRKSFTKALKGAEITDFHFHDLRHTFASQLIMNGTDVRTVQELMRHKDIRMTLRYTHLAPNYKRKAINSLGQRLTQKQPHSITKNNSLNNESDNLLEINKL